MDTHNISVCVAPSIFHKSDRQTLVDVESSFQTIAFVKHLIENCAQLFGEDTLTLLNPTPIQMLIIEQANIAPLGETAVAAADDKKENVTAITKVVVESVDVHVEEKKKQQPVMAANSNVSTLQKREFGRMLNLVSLKGRKSLAPKAAKTKTDLPVAKILSSSSSSTSSYSSTTSIQQLRQSQQQPTVSKESDQMEAAKNCEYSLAKAALHKQLVEEDIASSTNLEIIRQHPTDPTFKSNTISFSKNINVNNCVTKQGE